MSVLVLGGGGFIGRAVVQTLHGSGLPVRVLDRNPRPGDVPAGVEWLVGELAECAKLFEALSGIGSVVHLASPASPSAAERDWKGDVDAQLLGSIRLMEAMIATGTRRVVFLSSGGTVYGAKHRLPIAETAPVHPVTAYGINKLAVEHFLLHARATGLLDPLVLRVTNAYGPRQRTDKGQGIVGTTIMRALAGQTLQVWGDGLSIRDYVYVDDIASAVRAALDYTGPHAVFNIGSGTGRTILDVIAAIAKVGGFEIGFEHGPARGFDAPYNVLDCRLAHEELAWRPVVDFEQGLGRTLGWYRECVRMARDVR